MKVSVDEVLRMTARRKEINATPLAEIEWVDAQGNPVPCPPSIVAEFRFTGLSNTCFVECCYVDRETGFRLEHFEAVLPNEEKP